MASDYFDNYSALNDYINELPPPKPGHVRVFRGQCKDYGNMRPTGIRIPLRNEHVWRQYCRMLAADMLVQQGMAVEDALSRSDLWGYWYYAIVQHYGPGTNLLDVTRSLDVALWFALHRANVAKRIDLRYLSSGPTSHGPPLHRRDDWASYHKWTESHGVIFIFDVREWEPPKLPGHGVLVDLARAPEVFTRSARIQAQNASLIAADSEVDGGDLWTFLAHPPIKVRWPMSGSDGAQSSTGAIFPAPHEDEWYVRLLFLPNVHQVWDEEPHWRMAHPVQLTLYFDHYESSMYAVQFKPIQPPLLYPWLIEPALLVNRVDEATYEKAARFLRTVPILLEAPVFLHQLEPDLESLNQAELVTNLPYLAEAFDWVNGETPDESVLLTDVLLELSPLECVEWVGLLNQGAEFYAPRAVHLVRDDEFVWHMQVFFQRAPKEQIHLLFHEPSAIRFNSSAGRFEIKHLEQWEDISTDPIAAKFLFVSLMLMRALSPDPSLRRAQAVLKRAPDIGLGIRYYVMRDMKSGDPYTSPGISPR